MDVVVNECHHALAPTGCIAAVMEHGFQPSSGVQLSHAVTLIKFIKLYNLYINLHIAFQLGGTWTEHDDCGRKNHAG